jgi:hypothetical protein
MVAQTKSKQAFNLHDDHPLLGFSTMVAPTNQTASQGSPSLFNTPLSRTVQELLGRTNASSQVAPNLHDIIREGLQAKQVSIEAANSYLKDFKTIPRHLKFFGHFASSKMCQPHMQPLQNLPACCCSLIELNIH